MNKDQVKGAINDAAGRAKRQVGEWTDDPNAQVEGSAQQIKGKAQKAYGNVKDAAHKANDKANEKANEDANRQAEIDQDRERRNEQPHTHSGHNH